MEISTLIAKLEEYEKLGATIVTFDCAIDHEYWQIYTKALQYDLGDRSKELIITLQ